MGYGISICRSIEAETLAQKLDFERMQRCLQRPAEGEVVTCRTERFTPFAFPLVVEMERALELGG